MIPATACRSTAMSPVTCQISISLDGFVAGPEPEPENPLGEGGERLHEWVFATDGWRAQHGREGGERNADSEVVDEVDAGRRRLHHGPQDVRRRRRRRGTRAGRAGGATTRRSTRRSSCSPTTRASRSRWRAARRSTSSPTGSSPRSSRRARRPATRTSRSPAARAPCSSTSPPGCSTSSTCTSSRSCSAAGERLLDDVGDPTLEPVEVVASPGGHAREVPRRALAPLDADGAGAPCARPRSEPVRRARAPRARPPRSTPGALAVALAGMARPSPLRRPRVPGVRTSSCA